MSETSPDPEPSNFGIIDVNFDRFRVHLSLPPHRKNSGSLGNDGTSVDDVHLSDEKTQVLLQEEEVQRFDEKHPPRRDSSFLQAPQNIYSSVR